MHVRIAAFSSETNTRAGCVEARTDAPISYGYGASLRRRTLRVQCLLFVAIVGGVCAAASASEAPLSAARQTELEYLLDQDCGSCHGMTRKGGLGPALLPQNLEGKPDELLIATILDGRPGTAMPPWRGQLSEAEAAWLVEQLREGTD